MDNLPKDPIQHTDEELGEVTADCLHNPVVVRKILEHVSNAELLELSLVSKLWNYEARSVIRKRCNLMAHFKCDYNHPCPQDIQAFRFHLGRMNIFPLSGISIKLVNCCRQGCQSAALKPNPNVIFDNLSLKKVSVELHGLWWDQQGCSAFRLAKKVLQDFSGAIEELSLQIGVGQYKFIGEVVHDISFPRLRILKLKEEFNPFDAAYLDYMRAMVSRAPKLHGFHNGAPISFMLHLLEGSSTVPVCTSEVRAPFNEIPDSVISSVGLENMEMLYNGPEFDMARFNRVTPILLRTSSTRILRELWVDAVLSVPLMCFGICLENVEHLEMCVNYSQLELVQPRILSFVKDFDFTRIFPRLTKVEVSSYHHLGQLLPDHMDAIIETADAILREPRPDRAVNIKQLVTCESLTDNLHAQFYAEMFPSIDQLEISLSAPDELSFGSIWKHWGTLKEIKFRGRLLQNRRNLDSVICGIHPEEVADLAKQDEEFLRNVNIVPVMPAITCFRSLQIFSLDDLTRWYDPNEELILSKVTGLIAFLSVLISL